MSDQRFAWTIDRRIDAGHLLSTVTVLAAALAYAFHISARLDVVEVRQTAIEERVMRSEAAMLDGLARIERRLERLDDRLAEKADKS
ncbi:MAG: hypothetical protein CMM50_10195 [Rhodospirillaceae bacterium]|nr:hypothetical protein [Rhodospirillaceae bacterium]